MSGAFDLMVGRSIAPPPIRELYNYDKLSLVDKNVESLADADFF